jgi:putative membrane-bound dehydrogenase-like protein
MNPCLARAILPYTVAVWIALIADAAAQIPQPDDAPGPLSVEESRSTFRLPPGYRIDLVASEPLVREPSGICWDEHGRLFVCELHGYNVEGQFDIEELNKTGHLDRTVRRIQADERHKRAAQDETYGTVKLLADTNADGRFDEARVFADRLPPCYGICPARGGFIVACAPDVVYLADRDGDGTAETREVLFTGFEVGALERGVNAPQWGPDNWIYFGRGHGGGRISGPHLAEPVELPGTDFRIKSDGTAIEPIPGGTHTIGFTFTPGGERLVTSTQTPAIQVAPIPWRYLARNPNVVIRSVEHNAAAYNTVFPASRPHPWRTRRAEDPGFAKFYTDRYGIAESAPNGYFTSACSPLVYQDSALPGLSGQLLACEPAQNLVHRAAIDREGLRFGLRRVPGEEQSEFLASTDPWFHPISLAPAPDGSIWIVDFYREIIEDYSAIPRYLQQQYGLVNGREHGRIWRLTAVDVPPAPVLDFGRMSNAELAREVAGATHWRRQMARRLLVERGAQETAAPVANVLDLAAEPAIVLNALYTLDALSALKVDHVEPLLAHREPSVRVHALRACERWIDSHPGLIEQTLKLVRDPQAEVRLQAALTLGDVEDHRAVAALAALAAAPDADPWLQDAVLTGVAGRGDRLFAALLRRDQRDSSEGLPAAQSLLESLMSTIAAGRDASELSRTLVQIAAAPNAELQRVCLTGLVRSVQDAASDVSLDDPAKESLLSLATNPDEGVRNASLALVAAWRLESDEDRRLRLARAVDDLKGVESPVERRLVAVSALAAERDPSATQSLIEASGVATPQVRVAILEALFGRKDRLPDVMAAIETDALPASALHDLHRRALLEHDDLGIRSRAARRLATSARLDDATYQRFAAALTSPGDAAHGGEVFAAKCAVCHRAHGVGAAVGPDLAAESQRSPETILHDILAPSDAIAAGYASYVVETVQGRVFTGVLAQETANSIALRMADGKEQVILRKDVERIEATTISLMPENLKDSLAPQDVADLLAWLARPSD